MLKNGKLSESECTIFLSYSRNDDSEFISRLYKDLTMHGFDIWWDRISMPNRGLTFSQEIRDAIGNSSRLLAVLGPNALYSPYVHAEWEFALLFSKGVVPILRGVKPSQIPTDLRHDVFGLLPEGHAVDFSTQPYEEARAELFRILVRPMHSLGPFLTGVPALPPHFLPRSDELRTVGRCLLEKLVPSSLRKRQQIVAVHGMAGVGKSVIAAALARTTELRRVFRDGIIWIPVGRCTDPLTKLTVAALALNDDHQKYSDVSHATGYLTRLLEKRSCLIVLDDVWMADDIVPFADALGPSSRLLITTREREVPTALDAHMIGVDVLTRPEAMALLASWSDHSSGGDLLSDAQDIADACGYLPLALSILGAMARENTPWQDIKAALRQADLDFLRHSLPNYPHRTVELALRASTNALADRDTCAFEYYRYLVVLPRGVDVPESTVIRLWMSIQTQNDRMTDDPNTREREARRCLALLHSMALLRLDGLFPMRTVSLHALQQDFLLKIQRTELLRLHAQMLTAYQDSYPSGWESGCGDSYIFEYLPHHLIHAGRKSEVASLLGDEIWFRRKLERLKDIAPIAADIAAAHRSELPLRSIAKSLIAALHDCAEEHLWLKLRSTFNYHFGRYSEWPTKVRGSFERSQDLYPTLFVGNTLDMEGDYDAAEKCFRDLLDHSNGDPKVESHAFVRLAIVLRHASRYHDALDVLERYQSRSDARQRYGRGYSWIKYHYAIALKDVSRVTEARDILRGLIPQVIGRGLELATRHQLAVVDLELDDFERAEKGFSICLQQRAAKRQDHRLAHDHRRLGQVYALTGRFEQARQAFRRAREVALAFGDRRYLSAVDRDEVVFVDAPFYFIEAKPDSITASEIHKKFPVLAEDNQGDTQVAELVDCFRVLSKHDRDYLQVREPQAQEPIFSRWKVVHERGIWHATVIVLAAYDGRIALQRRQEPDSYGKWDASATGHVDVGEDDLKAALREIREELGIFVIPHQLKRVGAPYAFVKVGSPHERDRHDDPYSYFYTTEMEKFNREHVSVFIANLSTSQAKVLRCSELVRWTSLTSVANTVCHDPTSYASGIRQLLHPDIIAKISSLIQE